MHWERNTKLGRFFNNRSPTPNMRHLFANINAQNAIWSVVDVLVYPALFLFFTPFFIDSLGEAGFGVWMLFNTLLITVNFVFTGTHEATVFMIARAIGHNDYLFIRGFSGSVLVIQFLSGILVAMVLAMLGLVGLDQVFPEIHFGSLPVYSTVLCIMGIAACRALHQGFYAIFKAFERFGYSAGGNSLVRVLSLISAIVWVKQGGNILGIFGLQLLIHAGAIILLYPVVIKITQLKFKPSIFLQHCREMWQYARWFWSQALIGMLSLQVDRYLVAYYAGAAVLGYYTVVATIFNHIHMGFDALAVWIFPKISQWQARNFPVAKLYKSIQALIGFIGLTALVGFWYLHPPLLELWLGMEKYLQIATFIPYFILVEIFYLSTIVNKFYLNGINKMRENTLLEFFYKSAIIVTFSTAYFITKDLETMLQAMSLATAGCISVYVYAVNRLAGVQNILLTTMIDLLPTVLIFAALFFDIRMLNIVLISGAIFAFALHRKKYLTLEILSQ